MESNFSIYQLMQRYRNDNVNDILYSYDALKSIQVDQEFIAALLRLFEDERNFRAEDFDRFSLDVILDYIRRTHKYYLTKKLLEIEQSIHVLMQDRTDDRALLFILFRFYADYKAHLTEHIGEEESELLPYICYLQQAQQKGINGAEFFNRTKKYSLQKFISEHHDTEKDLRSVQDTILQYHPAPTNQSPYRILLSQLQSFEKDLAVHALMEDYILIPKALELEKKLMADFIKKAQLN